MATFFKILSPVRYRGRLHVAGRIVDIEPRDAAGPFEKGRICIATAEELVRAGIADPDVLSAGAPPLEDVTFDDAEKALIKLAGATLDGGDGSSRSQAEAHAEVRATMQGHPVVSQPVESAAEKIERAKAAKAAAKAAKAAKAKSEKKKK